MAVIKFLNNTTFITVQVDALTFTPNKMRIVMTVVEPVLFFYFYDNPVTTNERLLECPYTDVIAPVSVSATDLKNQIEAWLTVITGAVPAAHAASHENGGSDEINVVGLSGLLADGQTPLAHKTSHQSGGSDAIKLDDLAAPDDNTDLNVSITLHGLTPKAPNDTTKFLRGDATWAVPPSGSGGYTVVAVNFAASPYAVLPTSGITIYQVDCTGGNVVMNFPTAVGNTATYGVKKTDASANTITLTPNGAETIDTNATQTILFKNTEVDIYSDNANLFIK